MQTSWKPSISLIVRVPGYAVPAGKVTASIFNQYQTCWTASLHTGGRVHQKNLSPKKKEDIYEFTSYILCFCCSWYYAWIKVHKFSGSVLPAFNLHFLYHTHPSLNYDAESIIRIYHSSIYLVVQLHKGLP